MGGNARSPERERREDQRRWGYIVQPAPCRVTWQSLIRCGQKFEFADPKGAAARV